MAFWESVRQLVEKTFGSEALTSTPTASPESATPMACAILLAEIARSDFEVDAREKAVIENVLVETFSLELEHAKRMTETALEHVEFITSLHDYTSAINKAMNESEKHKLITALWRVALADEKIDKHESHWIKRIGDLLHLPRTFVMACRQDAERLS
jgi:uncharacterized tellurite resistance protein B-like protein